MDESIPAGRLAALRESWRRLERDADLPTRIPPAPDTFRARLSGVLVRILHRLFFAQAHQGAEWNRRLVRYFEEQNELIQTQLWLADERHRAHEARTGHQDDRLRELAAANARLRREIEQVHRLTENVVAARQDLQELAAENRRLRMWMANLSLPNDALLDPAHEAPLPALYPGLRNPDDEARWLDAGRLSGYLPFLRDGERWREPIFDLGSGSGIWLSLLQREGIASRGIEPDRDLYERALARALPVTEGGLLAFLRAQADESAGAITTFHTLDGLPYSLLSLLLDEIRRVLRPGAPFIWELRNRDSVLAIGPAYENDLQPKPVAFPRVRFWGESHGLALERSLFLHRAEDEDSLAVAPGFPQPFGVQFYGLIFRKPLAAGELDVSLQAETPETIPTRQRL